MFETLRALVSPRQAKLHRAFGLMEHFYFIANPDVASAVSRGDISSGLEHWITNGAREGRSYGGFSSAENAALLMADVQTLKQQLNENQERFNQLEALLTEHPAVASRGGVRNTTQNPYISIIMPTWNRGNIISDAISSIQSQRFSEWELIIIDDGSTDDTSKIVEVFLKDQRIQYHYSEHKGQSHARNIGLQLARGELIAYQDSDNLSYPDFLSAVAFAFSADGNLDVAYGALISNFDHFVKGRKILFEKFDRERLLEANYIAMTTLVHRRRLVDQWGGFDESLRALEDWDLILKYTQKKPAQAIPVLASRCRIVDQKRISDNRAGEHHRCFTKIQSKWVKPPQRTVEINGHRLNWVKEHYSGFWDKVQSGSWEPHTYREIDRQVTSDTVVIDIGANIGAIALYAAIRASRVICFEPDPISYQMLVANVAANPHLSDKITIVQKAVHASAGTLRFGSQNSGGDSMSSSVLPDLKTVWGVETITPGEIESMLPPNGNPVFVKMDIEGGEYELIPAAGALWARSNLVLLCSTHQQLIGRFVDARTLRKLTRKLFSSLRRYNLDCVTVDGNVRIQSLSLLHKFGFAAPMGASDWLFTPRNIRNR